MLGAPPSVVNPIISFLLQAGDLVQIPEDIILHSSTMQASKQKIVEYLQSHAAIESGLFKNFLGTTRKYSIPILEYWDSQGLTKRVGNTRVLKENG